MNGQLSAVDAEVVTKIKLWSLNEHLMGSLELADYATITTDDEANVACRNEQFDGSRFCKTLVKLDITGEINK